MNLHDRADRLARLMEDRLDIHGEGLAAKTRRAGRRVPRWVQRELEGLVEAMERAGHPKLAAQIDYARLESGLKRAEAWLAQVDPWNRRRGAVLDWLAGNAFNLLIVLALALAAMAWRGLI